MKKRKLALVAAAVALVAAGTGIGLAVTGGPTTVTPTAAVCDGGDPGAQIEGLASGTIFGGTGCNFTVTGVLIPSGVTLDGGRYTSTTTTAPILEAKGVTGVTLEDLAVVGSDPSHVGNASTAPQEGISLRTASNVTISHVTTANTAGDGLTIFKEAGGGPSSNVTVSYLAVNGAGRYGISPAAVDTGSFDHVSIANANVGAFDWESDVPGLGSSNVTISDSTWTGIDNSIEPLDGTIAYVGDTATGRMVVNDTKGTGTVTWTGGSVTLPRNAASGKWTGGIIQTGGNLSFIDASIARPPVKGTHGGNVPNGPAYAVTSGGHLVLDHTTVAGPPGIHDSTSTVTVAP